MLPIDYLFLAIFTIQAILLGMIGCGMAVVVRLARKGIL